jgi:hypothetical protein
MSSVSFGKIATALANVRGKTIEGVVLVRHDGDTNHDLSFQLYITFTDGTYYEFYGTGHLNGARGLDRGDLGAVREIVQRRGGEHLEIGASAD